MTYEEAIAAAKAGRRIRRANFIASARWHGEVLMWRWTGPEYTAALDLCDLEATDWVIADGGPPLAQATPEPEGSDGSDA